MIDLLKAALHIAAKKEIRFYLNGIHVYRDSGDGKVWLKATDGHVLMRTSVSEEFVKQKVKEPFIYIIPRASVEAAVKSLPLVILDADNKTLTDIAGTQSLMFSPIDGNFPDVIRLFNKLKSTKQQVFQSFGLSAELVTKVMKAVSCVAPKGQPGAKWPCEWQVKGSLDTIKINVGEIEFLIMPCRI